MDCLYTRYPIVAREQRNLAYKWTVLSFDFTSHSWFMLIHESGHGLKSVIADKAGLLLMIKIKKHTIFLKNKYYLIQKICLFKK